MDFVEYTVAGNRRKYKMAADEFFEQWAAGEISNPVITNANIAKVEILNPDEDDDFYGYDDLPDLKAKFVNCKIDGMDFYDRYVDLEFDNCDVYGIYSEFGDMVIRAKNSKISNLSLNENTLELDVKDTQMTDLELHKCHVYGKMKGGKFIFGAKDKAWLGQNDDLVMTGVDFGDAEYNADYFTGKYLRLEKPKMNAKVLAKLKNNKLRAAKSNAAFVPEDKQVT